MTPISPSWCGDTTPKHPFSIGASGWSAHAAVIAMSMGFEPLVPV
jgi:hypothetical protein